MGMSQNWEYIALGFVAILVIFNSLQIVSVSAALGEKSIFSLPGQKSTASSNFHVKSGGDVVQNVIEAVIPKGTPSYGAALSVSYDDPVPSLSTLAKLERQISLEQLDSAQKARFINVTSRISCEFCCGAPAVTDASGRSLCGCSHAASFRGLTKWILINEGDEWTDEQILAELTRWKALYYPRNMVEKGVAAVENGLEITPAVLNDINLLKKIKAGDSSSIGDLPAMVGGC